MFPNHLSTDVSSATKVLFTRTVLYVTTVTLGWGRFGVQWCVKGLEGISFQDSLPLIPPLDHATK